MTKTAIRKKVIDFVNQADTEILDLVYKLVCQMEQESGTSLMSESQKEEVESRSLAIDAGEIKLTTWSNVKNKIQSEKLD